MSDWRLIFLLDSPVVGIGHLQHQPCQSSEVASMTRRHEHDAAVSPQIHALDICEDQAANNHRLASQLRSA